MLACVGVASAAGPAAGIDDSSARITLLFDPRDPGSPSLTDVVSAAAGSGNARLRSDLGNPASARQMLGVSASAELRAKFAEHPMEARSLLENYLVLDYATSSAATAAIARLSNDPRVLAVASDASYTFSATPIDNYYPTNASPGNYQWGMRSLNMQQAWDLEFGHAYVADIDSGIPCEPLPNPCTGTSHPDLIKNFRLQFSKSFIPGQPSSNFNDFGGHGTHTAGIIAATPEYPPYFTNGQTNTGVAGTCWSCSLAMLQTDSSPSSWASALTFAADHGFQAANMSFGDEYAATRLDSCASPPVMYQAACNALQYAVERDVAMVASSGNRYENRVQFPARDGRVIAVGGIEYGDVFWSHGYGNNNPCPPGQPGDECGSNYGPEQQLVAPAKDIVSTFLPGATWNSYVHCGDSFGPPGTSDGYGDCTGTSMSAPYVTGIVGLMRSVNPLQLAPSIGSYLEATARPCTGTDSAKCGAGIPDAEEAIRAVLGNSFAVNLLLPLFEFYSDTGQDHFFTTSPQMAMAALDPGNLLPQPPTPAVSYDPNGTGIPSYAMFPNCSFGPCVQPRATVSIFGSMVSPLDGTLLVPLYRYSFACNTTITFCNTRPNHISHVYSAGNTERPTWEATGYRFDGVEGYIFSSTLPQPWGTVKLCRKYDPARDDYAMFPGSGASGTDCSATDDGTGQDGTGGNYYQTPFGTDWIGWVYPVQSSAADLAISPAANQDPSAIVTNLSGATFVNPVIHVQLDTLSAGIHFAGDPGCVSVPVSPPNFGSRAAFNCTLGSVGPGAVDKIHFWVQSGTNPGSGTMAVSLVTPTSPPDKVTSNNSMTAAVNFQPPS